MANERSGQTEITTRLSQNAAKNAFLIYLKETSVFRNDEMIAFQLGKKISQVIPESSMKVARHKLTKYNGWYAQGVEYISFGKPDQEQQDRYLFIDDYNAEVFEFPSEQEAEKVLEFNK